MTPAADIARHFAATGGDPLRDAFSRRMPVMPWRHGRPVEAEKLQLTWAELLAAEAPPRPRLAYVHVPFCANHCMFCGFYRNRHRPAAGAAYTELVVAEIEQEAPAPAIIGRTIDAVYLGGGTPSALSAQELSRILETIRRFLPLAADCEITVEGRVHDFGPDKIAACLEAGANRFSIGVQSFDTAVRRRQGRKAGREEVIGFLRSVRGRGAALVLDLIYGLPGQTEEIWRQDLRLAAELQPDGIDLYGLSVFPGTPLHKAIAGGKCRPAAPLADLGIMYRIGADFLAERGWRQVSNSHWARTALERNRYNLLIKAGVDCLAYGSGAGGSLGPFSYALAGSLPAYGDAVHTARKPLGSMQRMDALQPIRDLITAGFEVGCLDLDRLQGPARRNALAVLAPLIGQWQSAGLVEPLGDAVRLTTAGRFWYGNLIAAVTDVLCPSMPPPAGMSRPRPAAPFSALDARKEPR